MKQWENTWPNIDRQLLRQVIEKKVTILKKGALKRARSVVTYDKILNDINTE